MGFVGKLILSAFNRSEVIDIERDETKERGIFIPFSQNGIYYNKKGQVECYISVIDKKANLYGETHFIRVKTSKKRQTEMYKCGFKPVILGNLQKPGTKKKPRQKNIEDVL